MWQGAEKGREALTYVKAAAIVLSLRWNLVPAKTAPQRYGYASFSPTEYKKFKAWR
jgi:hypothetical protein